MTYTFTNLLCCILFSFFKVDLLKNKFGFDEAFNYKEEKDLAAALKRSAFFFELFSVKVISTVLKHCKSYVKLLSVYILKNVFFRET